MQITKDVVAKKMKRYLAARLRAESEVRQYLKNKFPDIDSDYEDILKDLEQSGWIDDRKFAAERARYRLDSGYGTLYIKHELASLKVRSQFIDEALSSLSDEEFTEHALKRIEDKLPLLINDPDCEMKLKKQLLCRGFSGTHTERSIKKLKAKYPHWARRSNKNEVI